MHSTIRFGIVGLGRMGGGLAMQAAGKGIQVVGYDSGPGDRSQLADAGVDVVSSARDLAETLEPPRVAILYVPAGEVVDEVAADLSEVFENGDIIVDGGNSYWGDSLRRHRHFAEKGIHFLDLGTSGGVSGAREGACFMLGGPREAVEVVEPILCELAVEGGYVHAGPAGAGHFVKLVHNGIEFGMLQAIAEGVDLLEHYDGELPVADVLRCWNHGSVIRSWLVELMEEQYRRQRGVEDVPPYIEDTGEVNWLIADAMQMERPIPVISQSVMQLFTSRDHRGEWARAVAMMRHGFGDHPFGPDEHVAKKRDRSRVGPIVRRHPRGDG